ncbi:putative UDP-glucose glucosyltransferase [Lolium rigidum]|uniref:putative UDP-glucose glucosyltransferase n=1 Tax=Lolium rigidum TaxID=89674 RepID=UPI001F5CC390|nr:putative UDP-glucose glucosyltransferase [Lolium rigidum]
MGCQVEAAMPPPAQPHVLLVSCPLQGHVNPHLRLGRRLAAKGLLVTFTTFLHAGLRGIHPDGACAGGVRFQYLLRERDDAGQMTPEHMLRLVLEAGPAALADLVRRQADAGRPVTCVVNTTFVPWALDVARDMGVPCIATLWTQSCAVLSLYHHFYNNISSNDNTITFPEAPENAPVALPGLPAMSMDELPLMVRLRPEFAGNLWSQMLRAQLVDVKEENAPSPWMLVNTFYQLERAAIDALPVAVVPLGPLLDDDDGETGDDDKDGVMAWLDAQPPRSVVYVAFGSLVDIGRDETAAVAEGFAGAGRPFLWVVRDDYLLHPPEPVLAAIESHNGKIVAWCPQRRVLSHGAVGCFVTHCGWNSVAEALAAGVPVVGYPWWSDQFTNAKFLVEEYGVGVRLPAPVKPDALRACVDKVMDGPEAAAIRARAATWKEEAATAIAHGGSSHRSLHDFVGILQKHV